MTQFLYDPGSKPEAGDDELVAEYNGSGALLRRYVHGLGTDDPILWYEGAGLADRRSLQADHQGSIIGVANGAGASIAINAYDEWGVPNAGNQGRFQYTGQAWLPELGMYHYKARIYSPTLGRFLQTDPVGYEDQVNLYAYVGNDPVNLVDPSGMETCPDNPDDICVVAPDDSAKLSVVATPGSETRKPQAPQMEQPKACELNKQGERLAELGETVENIGYGLAVVGSVTGLGGGGGLLVAAVGDGIQGVGYLVQFAAGDPNAGTEFLVSLLPGPSDVVPKGLRSELGDALSEGTNNLVIDTMSSNDSGC